MAEIFGASRFILIAGPCVLESDTLNLRVADAVAKVARYVPGPTIFKASFDKANRSNPGAPRGPGLERGLEQLRRIKEVSGLPVLTDVHTPEQCAVAAEVVDVLQIPAFLCRQTDLLIAAAKTGCAVNIKKGQWMSPSAMAGAVAKVRGSRDGPDSSGVALTERGTFFGYGDLVVDMRGIVIMQHEVQVPVIFDATHSVQRPGLGPGGSSGGAREFIVPLACAAVAAGANGVFIETHPEPDQAPSDGANMLPLTDLEGLVRRLNRVREASQG